MIDENHPRRDTGSGEQRPQPARQFAGRLDSGQPSTDHDDRGRRWRRRIIGQRLQVALERHGAVIGVDVKNNVATELVHACYGGFDHLAARRQHQAVVRVSDAFRGGDPAGVGVDRGHVGRNMGNSRGIEHVGERDAALAQIGFVVTDPDVVKRFGAQHSDVHCSRRDGELIESPGGSERRPEPREPGADHHHTGHRLNTPTVWSSAPV